MPKEFLDRSGYLVQYIGLRESVVDARAELIDRLADGEMPYDLCGELFGLEPDYLEELF